MNIYVISALLAPLLGPLIWKALHLPGLIASRLVWRYMPYGRIRALLLTETDPFGVPSDAPLRSAQPGPRRR